MPCCAIRRRLESGSEKRYLIIKELWEGKPLPVCFCNQGFRGIIVANMVDAEMLWQYILVDIDDLSEILTNSCFTLPWKTTKVSGENSETVVNHRINGRTLCMSKGPILCKGVSERKIKAALAVRSVRRSQQISVANSPVEI